MAKRPRGYGLTAEVKSKINKKYSEDLEQECRVWIETILDEELVKDADPNTPLGQREFHRVLKDGVILCRLMNEISPGSINKIKESKFPFVQMENINSYLEATRNYGLKQIDQFQTVDLYESENMTQVLNQICALGRAAQNNGFQGPALGPKEAKQNPRHFSEEQMRAGENVIGLQAGSNRGASQAGMNFGKTRSILD